MFRSGQRITARTYYWLINRWADVELVDGVGDFRLISRRAVDGLLKLEEYNRFSKGLFAWIGFESIVFEYENVQRETGKSRWTFRKLFEYGLDGMLSFNNKPLRLAIYFGLALTAVAVLYAIWVVAVAATQGVEMPGYVTLIAAIVGLGGIQMVMLGRDRRVHRPDLLRDQAAPALPGQGEQPDPARRGDRRHRHLDLQAPQPRREPRLEPPRPHRLTRTPDRPLVVCVAPSPGTTTAGTRRTPAPGGRTTRGRRTQYRIRWRSGGEALLGGGREEVQLVRARPPGG